MSKERIRKRWRLTTLLAWTGTALCLVLAILAIILASLDSSFTILAIPGGIFVATIVIPAILAGLVFVHANRQELVDRTTGPSKQ